MTKLAEDAFASDTVAEAIVVLENDPCLNAGNILRLVLSSIAHQSLIGYGSNLTLDGSVECDASIMDGEDDAFGSVGAVSGKSHEHIRAFFILIIILS